MRRHAWLVGMALVVSAAAVLLARRPIGPTPTRGEVEGRRPARPVEAPLPPRSQPARPVARPPAIAPASAPVHQVDPLLAALATAKKGTAVVIEVNALRNLPAGQLVMDCIAHKHPDDNPFETLKKKGHLDLLRDLDRAAVTEEALLVSGHFAAVRWGDLMDGELQSPRAYGDKAALYEPEESVDASGRRRPKTSDRVMTWNDELFYLSEDLAHAREVVDTLEGRTAPAPVLSEAQAYGEVYGVISPKLATFLLPRELEGIAGKLGALKQVEVHVDASHDVHVTAELRGVDPAEADELAKLIDAGLSLARFSAIRDADSLWTGLYGFIHVTRDGGPLRLEADIPLAFLEKELAWCRPDGDSMFRSR